MTRPPTRSTAPGSASFANDIGSESSTTVISTGSSAGFGAEEAGLLPVPSSVRTAASTAGVSGRVPS